MDMLEIGRGLKPEEEETHFGMWCIMSSPLLIGCDLTAIPASSLQLLKNKELIALNQDPLELQAYVVQHEHGGYVLVKDIEEKRGTVRAVALYNPTEETCSFRVPLSVLELEGTTRIRDLVKQKDERSVTDFIQFDVLPHGTKILRVEGERRMEPTRYEAEQAYLNQFDDLGKRKRGIAFMPFETASGGMTITNLGGHKDNYAQWNEVFSEQGGPYQMTVQYIPAEKKEREISDRRLEVTVNGNMTVVDKLETDRSKGVAQTTFTVNLQKGYNVLTYDQRSSNENTAQYTTFGYWEKYDLIDYIDYVHSYAPEQVIGVWGTSFGGATAGPAMGEKDVERKVDFLILDCPVSDMKWMVEEEMRKMDIGLPISYMTFCGNVINKIKLGFGYDDANVMKFQILKFLY